MSKFIICRALGLNGWVLEIDGLLDLDVQGRTLEAVVSETRKRYPRHHRIYLETDDFWLQREADPETLGLRRIK